MDEVGWEVTPALIGNESIADTCSTYSIDNGDYITKIKQQYSDQVTTLVEFTMRYSEKVSVGELQTAFGYTTKDIYVQTKDPIVGVNGYVSDKFGLVSLGWIQTSCAKPSKRPEPGSLTDPTSTSNGDTSATGTETGESTSPDPLTGDSDGFNG